MENWKLILPERIKESHKGTYGTVLVAAGSCGMAGAAYLSALAAYRTGVGLVKIYTPECNRSILQILLPEAVLVTTESKTPREVLSNVDAVVIGPGLGTEQKAVQMISEILSVAEVPILLDADALNILALHQCEDLLLQTKNVCMITPHIGEMARLTGVARESILVDKIGTASGFAKQYRTVVVLKDWETTIAEPDGRVAQCAYGSSALAKGGSGDVLSGIIGALLAQSTDPFQAAKLGVYLHGQAGILAASDRTEYGVLARETADHIPVVIKEILK